MEKARRSGNTWRRPRLWAGGFLGSAALVAAAAYGLHVSHKPRSPASLGPTAGNVVATYQPAVANGLITNEYTAYNPDDPAAKKSPDWIMTSGSLFTKDGSFWTGKPDSCNDGPNADSTNCTNSDVFRLNSAKKFSGNVSVSVTVKQNSDIHDLNCNKGDTCWHGAHIWLGYQSEFNLYYVSVNRADNNVVIKRKIPCGDDNNGTYKELSRYVSHPFTTGTWNTYTATLHHNTDGSNAISLYDQASGNTPIVTGVDRGGTNPNWAADCDAPGKYPSASYQPIGDTGSIGMRGDFSDMQFKDLVVRQQ